MRTLLALVAPLLFAAVMVGCMDDPIVGPEVKPRLILRPQFAYLRSVTGTTSLEARWTRSATDTQANFQGYYLQLFESKKTDSLGVLPDSVYEPFLQEAHVPKTDTSYVFSGLSVGKRYTVQVWSERVPDTDKPDSLILSMDYANASLDFDPAPIKAPTILRANAYSLTSVGLSWSASESANNLGFAGYIVRYANAASKKPVFQYLGTLTKFDSALRALPVPVLDGSNPITEYVFWVKAIRNDSTESDDSVMVTWSPAYGIPSFGFASITVGKKMFVGQTNFAYDIIESEQPEAQILISEAAGTVTLTASGNTKFSTRIDEGSLDSVFYSKPFDDAEFTVSEIMLPVSTPRSGVVVYVLLDGGARARLWFQMSNQSGGFVFPSGKVQVNGLLQPAGGFNLKYF